MREITFLHYRPGHSFWHNHDPRLKFTELAAWSILALSAGPATVAATGVLLLVLHILSGSRIRYLTRPLLFWAAMAVTIILMSGFSIPGRGIVIQGRVMAVSAEGLVSGTIRAGRLLVMLLAAQLLASTTDPAELSGAIRHLLFFLPRKWSAALAATIGLTLSFMPVLLDEAAVVRDAAFSRGLGSRRSPFRRALSLGLPLAEATLRRADLTAEALISRAFNENPTETVMRIRPADWSVFILVIVLPFCTILLPF